MSDMTPTQLLHILRDRACFSKFKLGEILAAHEHALAELDRRALLIVELRQTIVHMRESGHANKK